MRFFVYWFLDCLFLFTLLPTFTCAVMADYCKHSINFLPDFALGLNSSFGFRVDATLVHIYKEPNYAAESSVLQPHAYLLNS